MQVNTEDKKTQEEEIVVLSSMFSVEEFHQLNNNLFEVYITPQGINANLSPLKLSFSFPSHYPSLEMPVYTVSHPLLNGDNTRTQMLAREFTTLYITGEVVIFKWIDWLRDNFLSVLNIPDEIPLKKSEVEDNQHNTPDSSTDQELQQNEHVPTIFHGDPITDRKSKFQAHIAAVYCLDEVNLVVSELMKDKKIASATHNIYAYRFSHSDVIHENRNDDGETGAGDKLLYTLEKLGCVNIVVIVTRWFGGIMLGTDRFKHIVNVAKALIESKYQQLREVIKEEVHEKTKLRTSEDVYNRIKWDNDWNVDKICIGYEDRFAGVKEIPFSDFETSGTPFQRITYFSLALTHERIWDRLNRIDKIFNT